MVRLGFSYAFNLRFGIDDLLVQARQFRRAFCLALQRLRPPRKIEKLNFAPTTEENVVLLEDQFQNLARLPGDGTGGIG